MFVHSERPCTDIENFAETPIHVLKSNRILSSDCDVNINIVRFLHSCDSDNFLSKIIINAVATETR